MAKVRWTAEEVKIVYDNYKKLGAVKTQELLKNRTVPAVKSRAQKLGIQIKRKPAKGARANKLNHKYGITLDEYDALFNAQQGVCAICKQPETQKHNSGVVLRLAVDHQHSDGKIRGLLCRACNLMLGNSRENIETLNSAVKYLKERR